MSLHDRFLIWANTHPGWAETILVGAMLLLLFVLYATHFFNTKKQ
ncbi:hypothetical protein [Spirosoma litoris]